MRLRAIQLVGSGVCGDKQRPVRQHAHRGPATARPVPRVSRARRARRGMALPIAMTAVAIIAAMAYDAQMNAYTRDINAAASRDRYKAELLAQSGIDLMRLFMSREPQIRATVAPLFQLMMNRQPPQIPVWNVSEALLRPFCDYEGAKESAQEAGIDLTSAEGLGDTGGHCEPIAAAENGKINVNDPLHRDGDEARKSAAMQIFALVGGYHSPSPYDAIFDQRDADGQQTSRLDVVAAMLDWWDLDQDRTSFDPGAGAVSTAGSEDDIYIQFKDPYRVKNAPYDSLEELRMIRGVGDDFWSTFVQPDPDDPRLDRLTIYGSGNVNPNEAPPAALLARACSFLYDQPLCADPTEAAKFVQLLSTIRAIAPVPWFASSMDFVNFLEGRGGAQDLYPLLSNLLGPQSGMLFRPVTVPPARRQTLEQSFVTISKLLTFQVTGVVGRSRVRIRSVINFDERWLPPPPNAGTMPPLGVFTYYRMD